MKKQTNERPIPFTGPEVRAILDGRKTQTRRVVKPQPPFDAKLAQYCEQGWGNEMKKPRWCFNDAAAFEAHAVDCPYGIPGDRLWVKETWTPVLQNAAVVFRADGHSEESLKWKPSIHMPRSLSRITLEITAVRVERLGKITESDAKAEGISYDLHWQGYVTDSDGRNYHGSDPRLSFRSLWTAINGEDSWDANPWVWVVEFRKI